MKHSPYSSILSLCKDYRCNKGRCKKGFSLVELLVVLVLMGLVASLSFPNIQRSLLAYERNSMEDTLFVFLRQEMANTSLTGRALSIPKGQVFSLLHNDITNKVVLNFPASGEQSPGDFLYRADSRIHINQQGVCNATKVSLIFESASKEVTLKSPFCNKDIAADE